MNSTCTDRTSEAVVELRRRLIERCDETTDPAVLLDFALLELELARAGCAMAQPVKAFQTAMAGVRQASGLSPWLFNGAAGLGWLAARLSVFLGKNVAGTEVVDQVVFGLLADLPAEVDVDLPQGPLGLAVYGIAHPNLEVGGRIVDEVLRVIEDRAQHDEDGMYWLLTDRAIRAELNPGSIGKADLGVAHGQAGVVGLLSSVVRARIGNVELATKLLRDSTRWLLAQRSEGTVSHFGHVACEAHETSRDAWCYGDPGTALVLYQAAQALDDREIFAIAHRVSESVLQRPAETSEVVDASICHGTSFLAYLGHQLNSFDADLATAAFSEHWRSEVLAEIETGSLTYPVPTGGRGEILHFLEGDIGVALALLATVSPVRPVWTDLLLADFVPTAAEFAATEPMRTAPTLVGAV